ncbi:hypothetical protein [Clostridium perfringens]|uniref:hypothetical protein n=1 Tax=Clostridium perfringens TaxID=1502 RepID=UPI0023414EE8|nr:hypothetical protein [Clostridium perfringens]MDC4243519.1 hypothetical protein [Clostridium perfringens]HBZ6547132.1 hypothetical protein [Clostridium perfringens]
MILKLIVKMLIRNKEFFIKAIKIKNKVYLIQIEMHKDGLENFENVLQHGAKAQNN